MGSSLSSNDLVDYSCLRECAAAGICDPRLGCVQKEYVMKLLALRNHDYIRPVLPILGMRGLTGGAPFMGNAVLWRCK